MPNVDPAKVTADQKAMWDGSTETYAECVLTYDTDDQASKQILQAFAKQEQLPAGKLAGRVSLGPSLAVSLLPCMSVAAGSRVLDLASSFGRPAVPLAKELPHVSISATDLSPASAPLVHKYAASQGVTNVIAQTVDAQDLTDFSSNSFAAVTCSYGFMFMPDLDKALQEANRVLQPGGLLVATVWAEVEKCHNMQVTVCHVVLVLLCCFVHSLVPDQSC